MTAKNKVMELMHLAQGGDVIQMFAENYGVTLTEEQIADLNNRIGDCFTNHFSETELEIIIALYKTPVLKKYFDKQPEILRECQQIGMEWAIRHKIP